MILIVHGFAALGQNHCDPDPSKGVPGQILRVRGGSRAVLLISISPAQAEKSTPVLAAQKEKFTERHLAIVTITISVRNPQPETPKPRNCKEVPSRSLHNPEMDGIYRECSALFFDG